MSTLIDPFAQFVQRGKDAAVKAVEVWSEASDEAFAKLTDWQERFGTLIDKTFDIRQQALDFQREAAADIVAAGSGTVGLIVRTLPAVTAWRKLAAKASLR
jgi:hypothetical protein